MIVNNKKAYYEYFITDKFTAGIVLRGSEIKSARAGKLNFTDSYCQFIGNELFIKHMHISEYEQGTIWNHEPKRERKLLLEKKELKKIQRALLGTGMTIVPLNAFISKTGYLKIQIGIAKGKKLYDKRESIKKRDLDKENSNKN